MENIRVWCVLHASGPIGFHGVRYFFFKVCIYLLVYLAVTWPSYKLGRAALELWCWASQMAEWLLVAEL